MCKKCGQWGHYARGCATNQRSRKKIPGKEIECNMIKSTGMANEANTIIVSSVSKYSSNA